METPRRLADPERDGTLYVYDLDNDDLDTPVAPPPVSGARLRPADTPADAPALRAAMRASGEYPDDIVEIRLRDGRLPYVAEADGKVVSYGWVALSAEPIGDLGLSFRLRPDEAYVYDCATRPDYRGRGLYPALLRFMLGELRRGGRRRAWIGTAPGNYVSQRGIARAGFAKVADVHIARRPDGSPRVDLYGVPGVAPDLLERAAWSFQGQAHPESGVPQE